MYTIYLKIGLVVDELKRRGENVLLLLPDCYVNRKSIRNSITISNRAFIEKTQEDEVRLYIIFPVLKNMSISGFVKLTLFLTLFFIGYAATIS